MKLLLLVVLVSVAVKAEDSQVLKSHAAGQIQFTANVYKELVNLNPGNFLVSPISIEVVLAAVHDGAKGKTAKQLSASLQFPEDKEEIRQMFLGVIPHLHKKDRFCKLTSANKVYLKNGFEINEQFKNTTVNVFGSEIQNIDFEKNELAASDMNKWVEERTEGNIKNLINKNILDEYTRAVLINALYFEAQWASKFPENSTKKEVFHVNSKNKVDMDMMKQTNIFKYYECSELNAKFLEIPYRHREITMTFILPNDIEALSSLEARIADVFTAPEYKLENVNVVIPKFKIETSIEFKPILRSLGVVDAFEDLADFTGIGVFPEILKISEVTQKSFIEIDEKGTIAAAGSFVSVDQGRSVGHHKLPLKDFIADRPFIYYIKSPAGILFSGRYIQP